MSCFIVRSSAHDSVVFAVGRFRLRTRGGDASQLRSRARRKNMDSVHSPCRVDALHHAAQLLQAGLRDADGVLLLDGDEELGRHGRSLPRVREQVPLERPDGGHDCLAPFEVTPGQKNRRGTFTTKTAAPRKAEFLERGDETTTTAIIDRAPSTRLEPPRVHAPGRPQTPLRAPRWPHSSLQRAQHRPGARPGRAQRSRCRGGGWGPPGAARAHPRCMPC